MVPTDDLVARFLSQYEYCIHKNWTKSKIRIDAYPYNEFGEISGKIDSIGSDIAEPDEKYNFFRFPVTVKLEEPYILRRKKNYL